MNQRNGSKQLTCNINDTICVSIVAYDQPLIYKPNKINLTNNFKFLTNPVRSQMTLKCVGATVP